MRDVDAMARLFEQLLHIARFARGADDVRSGSGLGLSICETAMRRMGGTFRLEPSVADCLFVMTFQTVPDPPAMRTPRQ